MHNYWYRSLTCSAKHFWRVCRNFNHLNCTIWLSWDTVLAIYRTMRLFVSWLRWKKQSNHQIMPIQEHNTKTHSLLFKTIWSLGTETIREEELNSEEWRNIQNDIHYGWTHYSCSIWAILLYNKYFPIKTWVLTPFIK